MNPRTCLRGLSAMAVAVALGVSAGAQANDELLRMQDDPNQWVMWGGNYAGTRYSELDQINAGNARHLQPVWTFSTGVLRETEMAESLRDRMGDIETAAEKACFQPPPGAPAGG